MSDKFKTPLPKNRVGNNNEEYFTPIPYKSDSEESVSSNVSETPTTQSSNSDDISVVAQFDDLMRFVRKLKSDRLEETTALLEFAEQAKIWQKMYTEAQREIKLLQDCLKAKTEEVTDLGGKLVTARKILDDEKARVKILRRENGALEDQISRVKKVFQDETAKTRMSDDFIREKLSFLNANNGNGHLSAIKEINSTGSLLSDYSVSRSEDDLDDSMLKNGKSFRKHRASVGVVEEPLMKKRRSSNNRAIEINTTDTVRATTTLTVTKEGPIRATSVIESVPQTIATSTNTESVSSAPPTNLILESWAKNGNLYTKKQTNVRQHTFQNKCIISPDTCVVCEKRIRFGKTALKCKDCKGICHLECKDLLPLPCIPLVNTPNKKNMLGIIGDYTPTMPPMVPALLIHCINEIELRGMNEIGIYRIPGSERDVKCLKEKFLKGRGAPCLNNVDIHVICGTVKDFLRSLHEPIITYGLWKKFVDSTELYGKEDCFSAIYSAIDELPQPNRDTLAYMILHLQRISQSKDCKMSIGNLAKVFGPTIVGYSSDNPDMNNLLTETRQQAALMEYLMEIPKEYWQSFIDVKPTFTPSNKLQQTPSTDSLLRPMSRSYFTPNRTMTNRKQRFFATPPSIKF